MIAIALSASSILLLTGSKALAGAVLTVNSAGDASDASPGDGVCDTGNTLPTSEPECTLRAAIEEANEPGPEHEVVFSIPGGNGVHTIRPTTPLPPVTRPLQIDARTQTGFEGAPIVVVDGSALTGGNGIDIVGDGSSIRGLAIWGHGGAGIVVRGDRNIVAGNYVGNGGGGGNGGGVVVFGSFNVIGGTAPADANVISGNQGNGIILDGAAWTEVAGNLIGLDPGGGEEVANQESGIAVLGPADRITLGPGNVISGNNGHGIAVGSDITRVEIVGNKIGTDVGGAAAVGNSLAGIHIASDQVIVRDNQVAGNAGQGLLVVDGSAIVRGNLIGTDADGTTPVPNGGHGVEIRTRDGGGSVVGGIEGGEGNVIAYNGGDGVSLGNEPASRAAIVSNSIFANRGLGIGFGGRGPTPNDPGDLDEGPNDLLNHPVISRTVDRGSEIDVHFELDVPDGSYRVEFFVNPSGVDPGGFGEGEVQVSSVNVRKTSGSSQFVHTIAGSGGEALTATSSRCANPSCKVLQMTSEFSRAFTVQAVNHPPVLGEILDRSVPEGTLLSFTAVASDEDRADTLTFGLVGEPAGASIDASTGTVTWTPNEAQGPGVYSFVVWVADDGEPRLSDTESISVVVEEVNAAPQITHPGPMVSASGDSVDLTIVAIDPDSPPNTLTYEASGLPEGLTIDADTGRITGVIRRDLEGTRRDGVTVTVTDDGDPPLSDEAEFTWETTSGNRAPVLADIGAISAPEESRITLTAEVVEGDNDRLRFSLVGESFGAAIDEGTGVFSWTPTEIQGPGTYTFVLSVSDSGAPSLRDVESFTVNVTEINKSPQALDDVATTAEDTPLTIDVLANDRDLDVPADTLLIRSVAQPDHGQVSVVPGGVAYMPPRDFNGEARFEYTVEDGVTATTGTVSVAVAAVNDAPVAVADRVQLDSYQPSSLDVTANDFDPDQDPLAVDLTQAPSIGTAAVVGDQVVYEPVNGWTGSLAFRYSVSDPSGERSEAVVEVVIGEEVLVAAQRTAADLGADAIPLGSGTAPDEVRSGRLIDLAPLSLLAESFLHAVDALKVPLGLLALTVAFIHGFGTRSEMPAVAFGSRRNHWAVARLPREQRLPASVEPGVAKAVYLYEPTATGIVSTGRSKKVDGLDWLPVDTPKGSGWMPQRYLIEQTDLQSFSQDPRPVRLVHQLAECLSSGKSISNLIGSGGLTVVLSGHSRHIALGHLDAITSGPRHTRAAEQVPMAPGEFSAAVAKPLLEAYAATPEVTVDLPHSRTSWIPTECWNMPYLALGQGGDVQPWLVFFEYRHGRAFIAGLGIDE